jgi:hypothetical protein
VLHFQQLSLSHNTDSQRGYLLELLMSKLQFMQRSNSTASPQLDLQIVAMSATLPNLEEVAGWMDATLFRTDFRPVRLQESYKLGDNVYDPQGRVLRQLRPCGDAGRGPQQDPDRVVTLVEEACLKGDQVSQWVSGLLIWWGTDLSGTALHNFACGVMPFPPPSCFSNPFP